MNSHFRCGFEKVAFVGSLMKGVGKVGKMLTHSKGKFSLGRTAMTGFGAATAVGALGQARKATDEMNQTKPVTSPSFTQGGFK